MDDLKMLDVFMKLHEEAMEDMQAITQLQCMIDYLQDEIKEAEIKKAEYRYNDRDDVEEETTINVKRIKMILGMKPEICKEADAILKEREQAKEGAKDE